MNGNQVVRSVRILNNNLSRLINQLEKDKVNHVITDIEDEDAKLWEFLQHVIETKAFLNSCLDSIDKEINHKGMIEKINVMVAYLRANTDSQFKS
jgi:septation ring formation regulator EzrA